MEKFKNLKNPEIQYRPDVRWWLAEGFHTDETLKNDIAMLHDAGFGAIEFLAMEEPGADSKLYGWGSEEWVHDTKTVVEETTKRGMGVSMTSGTNWSNANLITITPDDKSASKELDYAMEDVAAGESRSGELLYSEIKIANVTKQELVAVVAVKDLGEKDGKHYLDKDAVFVLTDQVKDGKLTWTAPEDGDYKVFFFWIHGTGQTAAPSVSTSYTINYIDRYGIDAFIEYWDNVVLTDELRKNLTKNARGMMYMDSLELSTYGKGGHLWGYHFMEEFQTRRGYDLTPYLPFIVRNAGMMVPYLQYHFFMEDTLFAEKLYNDLYQTMTDMYMENILKPMQEWLHGHDMTLRAEISYGVPFEISLPGKYVDGIETESLEFASQIEPYRTLAGPAHIYGRTYSSETGATLMNYMQGLDFYTQIIFTQFAAGVTKTVLHGYSSIAGSDDSTYWPGHEGMWPIFSERFGCRQPAWCHYNDWTNMVARYQMMLRRGKPRMDIGIVRLDYYFNNLYMFGDERDLYEHRLMRGDEGVYWKDMQLQQAGYTWDYFAPQILEEDFVDFADGALLPDGPGYQALIIYQEMMPLSTAKKLLVLAKKGLPIIFVNGVTETIRPMMDKTHAAAASMTPFNDGADEALAEVMAEIKDCVNVRVIDDQTLTKATLESLGILPRVAFEVPNNQLLTLAREDDQYVYVYAYNMKYADPDNCAFKLLVEGKGTPYRIDCWSGDVLEVESYTVKNGRTEIVYELKPGDACLFAVEKKDLDGTYKVFETAVQAEIPVEKWHLVVEDWNEGDKKVIVEDRGLGIVTKEVYYETKKTLLDAGEITLKPWKDIPEIGPEVSGVGRYTAKVTLPENWGEMDGAILSVGSYNGNSAAVYVNGTKATPVNFDLKETEIGSWLNAGENTITVEVSSTLNNRLLARGYYDRIVELSMILREGASNAGEGRDEEEHEGGSLPNIVTTVHDYGMTGEVKLVLYKKVRV